jgi:heat shock protein HtpX
MIVAAAVLWLVDAVALAGGSWLVVTVPFGAAVPVGLVLVLLAIAARPRFGRRPPRRRRHYYDESPTLFALIHEVTESLSAAPPGDLALDLGDLITFDRVGIRRHRVLSMGGALWTRLGPAQRVAALACAVALDGSGDPYRHPVVAPARAALAAIVTATLPERRRTSFLTMLGRMITRPVGRIALLLDDALTSLGRRAHEQAVLLADERAGDIAGADAVVGLAVRLDLDEPITRLLHNAATHRRPAEWCGIVDDYVAARRPDLADGSIHAAARSPRVVLPAADSERIDADLEAWIAAVHREILGTRDFAPRTRRRAG